MFALWQELIFLVVMEAENSWTYLEKIVNGGSKTQSIQLYSHLVSLYTNLMISKMLVYQSVRAIFKTTKLSSEVNNIETLR